jgi:peptidoglycan hydrolase-like protein with peptidoglycan-binding domain
MDASANMAYTGRAAPLSPARMSQVADTLGVPLVVLWAVLGVETSGCGFLPDRRPKLLFERHVFHRLTAGRFADAAPSVSAPAPGGYERERGAAWQYERLARAWSLDAAAALASSSWGLPQIMGFNAAAAGFEDAAHMAAAFADSEDAQLGALAAFLAERALVAPLARRDWRTFALRYNGPARVGDQPGGSYADKLARWHARYEAGPLPDLLVRGIQIALMFRGLLPSWGVDGLFGPRTKEGLAAFQRLAGVRAEGRADDATLEALWAAAGWVMA